MADFFAFLAASVLGGCIVLLAVPDARGKARQCAGKCLSACGRAMAAARWKGKRK